MELKVWVDGHQRLICGIGQQTTCQEVIYALAHATGKTGRFVLVEKWRTSERSLSPHDKPLELLFKWGEYASDVQFVLKCLGETYPEKLNSRLDNINEKQRFPWPQSSSSFFEKSPQKGPVFATIHANPTENINRQHSRIKSCSTGHITMGQKENPSADYAEIRRPNGPKIRTRSPDLSSSTIDSTNRQNDPTASGFYSIKLAIGRLANDFTDTKTTVTAKSGNGPQDPITGALFQPAGLCYNRKPIPPKPACGQSVPKPPRSHIEAFFPPPSGNEKNYSNRTTFSGQTVQPCQRSPGARRWAPPLPDPSSAPHYETSTLPRQSRHYNVSNFSNATPHQFSSKTFATSIQRANISKESSSITPGSATIGPNSFLPNFGNSEKISPSASFSSCQGLQYQSKCFENQKSIMKTSYLQGEGDCLKPQTWWTPSKPPRPPPPSYEKVMKQRRMNNYAQILPLQKRADECDQNKGVDDFKANKIGGGTKLPQENTDQLTWYDSQVVPPTQQMITTQADIGLMNRVSSELSKTKLENSNKAAQVDSLANKCQRLDDEILSKRQEISKLNEVLKNEEKILQQSANCIDMCSYDSESDEECAKLNEILKEKRKRLDELDNKLLKDQNLADFSNTTNCAKNLPLDGTDFSQISKINALASRQSAIANLSEIVKETTAGVWV